MPLTVRQARAERGLAERRAPCAGRRALGAKEAGRPHPSERGGKFGASKLEGNSPGGGRARRADSKAPALRLSAQAPALPLSGRPRSLPGPQSLGPGGAPADPHPRQPWAGPCAVTLAPLHRYLFLCFPRDAWPPRQMAFEAGQGGTQVGDGALVAPMGQRGGRSGDGTRPRPTVRRVVTCESVRSQWETRLEVGMRAGSWGLKVQAREVGFFSRSILIRYLPATSPIPSRTRPLPSLPLDGGTVSCGRDGLIFLVPPHL